MGVGAGLDHVILFDLLVEERVEAVLARAEGVDLSHQYEYRKSGFFADIRQDVENTRSTERGLSRWAQWIN